MWLEGVMRSSGFVCRPEISFNVLWLRAFDKNGKARVAELVDAPDLGSGG